MKRSCSYCGRIHERSYDCEQKPVRIKRRNDKDSFRSTAAWQRKAIEIKERDHYICQLCIRNIAGTKARINTNCLSVHHNIPLQEDFEKRLDNDNLITVCDTHHEMAESGAISREIVQQIIDAQENSAPGSNNSKI